MTEAGRQMFFNGEKPYVSKVEYLKSTGTQWIDTGVKSSGEMEVEIQLHTQYTGFVANNCYYVFGYDPYFIGQTSRETAFEIGGGTQYSGSRGCTYGGEGWFQGDYQYPNEKTVAQIKGLMFQIGGTTHYTCSSKKQFAGGNCYLFACNQPGTSPQVSNPNMKCYSCKVWVGGILERDLVPVRIKNEIGVSEGAMYDQVSKSVLRNAGTGSFEIGADVD